MIIKTGSIETKDHEYAINDRQTGPQAASGL